MNSMATRTVSGKEVSLPEYMSTLPQEEIDRILAEDANDAIISCGINPIDRCLMLITSTLSVREIKPNGRLIPDYCRPLEGGTGILVKFERESKVNYIDAALAIDRSQDCLCESKLFLNNNYLCDVEVKQEAQAIDENEVERTSEDDI